MLLALYSLMEPRAPTVRVTAPAARPLRLTAERTQTVEVNGRPLSLQTEARCC